MCFFCQTSKIHNDDNNILFLCGWVMRLQKSDQVASSIMRVCVYCLEWVWRTFWRGTCFLFVYVFFVLSINQFIFRNEYQIKKNNYYGYFGNFWREDFGCGLFSYFFLPPSPSCTFTTQIWMDLASVVSQLQTILSFVGRLQEGNDTPSDLEAEHMVKSLAHLISLLPNDLVTRQDPRDRFLPPPFAEEAREQGPTPGNLGPRYPPQRCPCCRRGGDARCRSLPRVHPRIDHPHSRRAAASVVPHGPLARHHSGLAPGHYQLQAWQAHSRHRRYYRDRSRRFRRWAPLHDLRVVQHRHLLMRFGGPTTVMSSCFRHCVHDNNNNNNNKFFWATWKVVWDMRVGHCTNFYKNHDVHFTSWQTDNTTFVPSWQNFGGQPLHTMVK